MVDNNCFTDEDGNVWMINPDGSLSSIDLCVHRGPPPPLTPDPSPTSSPWGGWFGGGIPWILPITDPGNAQPGIPFDQNSCMGGLLALILAVYGFLVFDLVLAYLTIFAAEIPGVNLVVTLIDTGVLAVEATVICQLALADAIACQVPVPPNMCDIP